MPTIPREGPYRFFFYASDWREPSHVHVQRDDKVGKFWLAPVRLQRSGGLRRAELRRIARIIDWNRDYLREAWDEYFDD
ncbi:MAG: DUF4160 domain-containing protein [bacterium]|nr:DUF4160 domain-containing protein [bacterium]